MSDSTLDAARWLGVATSQIQHIADETLSKEESAQYLGVSVGAIDKMVAAIGAAPAAQSADQPEAEADMAVPEGTVAEVMVWVGDDPLKATAALVTEQKSPSPRSTLITQLEGIINA